MMTSHDAKKLLRVLTHAHLLRPYPQQWLVAADLLEEQGDAPGAALWRRRGEWFPVVMSFVEELRGLPEGTERRVTLGPLVVTLRRTPKSVFVTAWGRSLTTPFYEFWWGYHTKDGERYLNRCCVAMIDGLHRLIARTERKERPR